jgi:iron complex outermembrane receptor protein
LLAVTTLSASLGAQAQPAPAPQARTTGKGVESITVTAQRREQSLQKVPVSVSVLTAAQIARRSITNVTALARSLPNVTATNGPQSPNDANFFIRGIGQYDFIITNDPGVGIYIDGVYLGRTVGAQLDTLGIARVEVLRGPQGALFGRNTIGGAVNVVTEPPKPTKLSATLTADVGDYGLHTEQADVNIPLSDRTAIRLLGIDREEDGYARRPSDGAEFGAVDTKAGRINLLSHITDELTLTAEADYTHNGGTQLPVVLTGALPGKALGIGPQTLNVIPGDYLKYLYNPNHPDVVYDNGDPNARNEAFGGAITLAYDAGFATFKSITGFRGLTSSSVYDPGGTPYDIYVAPSNARQLQVSEELQAYGKAWNDRIDYIGGFYYFHENARQLNDLCLAQSPFAPYTQCADWHQGNVQSTDSLALFGQVTGNVTSKLSVVVGGRVNYDQKSVVSNQFYNLSDLAPGLIIPIETNATRQADFRNISPKAGINYQYDNNTLIYGSFTTGFRSGGFNGRVAVPGAPIETYQPDTDQQWEVGTKLDLLGNKLRVNLSGFYTTYKNIQLTVVDPKLAFYVANAGGAELYGFESEFTAQPTDNLTLRLGLGYTENSITQASAGLAPSRVSVGNSLPFTPLWNTSFAATYVVPLTGTSDLALDADVTAQTHVYFSPSNQPLERQNGYGIVNLRTTYEFHDGKYSVGMFVRNLTDRRYFTFGEDAVFNQGVSYDMLARGRDFGATLTAHF